MRMSLEQFHKLVSRIDNSFVGSEEHVYGYQAKYASFFDPALGTVADIGCGQGAFLRALTERNVPCVGIDFDQRNIDICTEKGYTVLNVDASEFMDRNTGKLGGIALMHVIEHYDGFKGLQFLVECHEALKQGGVLVLITPNFADEIIHKSSFWVNSSHIRPYPLPMLKNALEHIGFYVVTQGFDPFGGDAYIVGMKK